MVLGKSEREVPSARDQPEIAGDYKPLETYRDLRLPANILLRVKVRSSCYDLSMNTSP